jgi:hypothetical protein
LGPATLMAARNNSHLTPNGKIDRKTLPEPVRERSTESECCAPLRTETEKILAENLATGLEKSMHGQR